ncbi:MAG: hypothetical protein NTX66_00795 [Candidatus Falkowbacteria bacterium]|nr:hypothetical protein [Candidatus Falkowbacteria bacterium]
MNLKEAQDQTLLSSVNEIFEKGEFNCPVEEEATAEGEAEIGEVTDYEKAIWLAKIKVANEHNEMIKKHEEALESESNLDPAVEKLLKQQSAAFEFLDNFFWENVKYRLNGIKADAIGIRKGWKIFIIEAKGDEDCENCPARSLCPNATL